MVNAIDLSADVFIEESNRIIAIELKSVKPNSGEMRGEKDKILQAKAALFHKFPGKQIEFYIGFPFDPTDCSAISYNKSRFTNSIINMNKYFSHEEVLLSEELWNLLSGHENTMSDLLSIINDIATTDFMENFNYINDPDNRGSYKYINILKQWKIYSELEMTNAKDKIEREISTNKSLQRVYNPDRYDKLKHLI